MDSYTPDPGRVVSVILGGGAGTRLFPLTKERAKPAVPLAGKYRLVDIPISLCINSGLKRIFLLTQYLSSSMHRHVQQSYRFDDYNPRGFIEIMAATQSSDLTGWYQGTADAVRQNLRHFRNHKHDLVLILSGDQLYRMDYRHILSQHVLQKADVTVATIPVDRAAARGFGIMHIDREARITRFVEKPKEDAQLDSLVIEEEARKNLGLDPSEGSFLASMGIYVFNREVLESVLEDSAVTDFGKDVIPGAIRNLRVFSHVYRGYWEDIGTIRAFYDANLDLTEPVPKFNFYDAESPIYTRSRYLPASKIDQCQIERATVSDGCIMRQCNVFRSIIGIRSRLDPGVNIRDSILMGADYYESLADLEKNARVGRPNIGVGPNTVIEGAIVDKNSRIGANVVIRAQGKPDTDGGIYYVRDGVVIIPKDAVVPDGTVI
ncbi:MAG: glucose-1-phosphate adenylyltransferase [Candidatus Methylacidiphilales bacterium]|nr:glucose-1-phosphate adenylyltransferase [Candidatus Methylacidiphilales bacterium]